MKGKGGPSFFDVLRTTMKQELHAPSQAEERTLPPPSPAPATVPAPTAKPLLRPVSPPPPEPPISVEPAKPVPPATPALSEAEDPDRKAFQVSHTAALFGLLIGMILLLLAFYAGIRVGRTAQAVPPPQAGSAIVPPVPPAPASEAPVPVAASATEAVQTPSPSSPPPPTAPKFTIHLMSWPAGDREEKERADRNAAFFANYLSEKGFEDLAIVPGQGKVTLYMGKFASNTAPEARKVLDAVRAVQYSSGSNPPKRIFQRADFAPISQRQP